MYEKINTDTWQQIAQQLQDRAVETPFGQRGPDGRDPAARDLLRMIQDTATQYSDAAGDRRAWLWKCLEWFETIHAYRRRELGEPVPLPALPWHRDAAGELEPEPPPKLKRVIDKIAAGSGWRVPWQAIGARYVEAVTRG
ncbi:MAG: hypothetical protein KAT00_04005 [Planctomycetes bacterium]|nr:hypothetical protein [Planctomycetota bacterium]